MGMRSLFHVASPATKSKEKENPEEAERLSVVWKGKVRDPNDYMEARDGDHLLVPFECDLCIFRKLRGKNPDIKDSQDELLVHCIRRMNLDAFWSRSSATIYGNRDKAR